MFAGEYVATKSQNEVLEGEIKLEHEHIKRYHAEEMQELANLLTLISIPKSHEHLADLDTNESEHNTKTRKLRRRIRQYYASNPDALLKLMIALEFSVIYDEVRSPVVAGGTSFILFIRIRGLNNYRIDNIGSIVWSVLVRSGCNKDMGN